MAQSRQTRRGASRSPRKKSSRRQVPGWVWLFTGVVAGLFVAFLVHLGGVQMAHKPAVATQSQNSTDASHDTGKQDAKSGKGDQPKFDFYAVLPKMEVIVPKGDDGEQDDTHPAKPHDNDNPPSKAASSATPKATSPAPAATAGSQRYMLQAGSFRHEADADRRRAKLTLRGFQVSIQPVQLDSGDTWHRVMIGPYTTLASLHDAQDKLVKQGVETLPIQIKE